MSTDKVSKLSKKIFVGQVKNFFVSCSYVEGVNDLFGFGLREGVPATLGGTAIPRSRFDAQSVCRQAEHKGP